MGMNITSRLTADEQLLLNRCEELFSRAEKGILSSTQFLDSRQRFIIEQRHAPFFRDELSEPLCLFWGGFPSAQRVIFVCMPTYLRYVLTDTDTVFTGFANELSELIVPLRIKSSGYVNLCHRDYLGALIGLGLERACIGDIVIDSEGAIIFVQPSVVQLIKNELLYVGRDKVRVSDVTIPHGFDYVPATEKISGTVASPRLDAVVSELVRTSRENAKLIIKQGLVEHNYFTASEADTEVNNGDIITVRKTSGIRGGKFTVDSIDSLSSKGRIRLAAHRYI